MSDMAKHEVVFNKFSVAACVVVTALSFYQYSDAQKRVMTLQEQLAKSMENTEKAIKLVEKSEEAVEQAHNLANRVLKDKDVAVAALSHCGQELRNLEMLLKYLKDKK